MLFLQHFLSSPSSSSIIAGRVFGFKTLTFSSKFCSRRKSSCSKSSKSKSKTIIVSMASNPSSSSSSSSKSRKVLDAHLHVWPTPGEYSYQEGKVPPVPGSVEELVEVQAKSGVAGAMIVQPINLLFDHEYLEKAVLRYPGKFVLCALANPSPNVNGEKELEKLLHPAGAFKAVRFNPGLWPEKEKMTNDVGKRMFRMCGEKDAVVGFMCFHGLDKSYEEMCELMTEFPKTRVLIDHFGFARGISDPNWQKVLSLAKFPQVSVKVSAQFRVAAGEKIEWPYESTFEQVKDLVKHFGAERLVWGSDFPFVVNECGYEKASQIVNEIEDLTEKERDLILGGSLEKMFPKSFYSSS